MSEGVLHLPLCELAALIRAGEISSTEVTQASIAAATRLNGELGCFLSIDADEALAAARTADREIADGVHRGLLHGVPLAHKDMFYQDGKPSTGGSKIRRDFVAETTATVIHRLRQAGAIAVGRLGMSEFAAWPTGHNDHYGTPRNPWNTAHITGGSSSGSACAVAARIVYASLGSDTGGSIRVPAGICGVVGLKPTYGRVSRQGALPRVWSLDAVGPIARTVRDAALLLNAVAGHDPLDAASSEVAISDYCPAENARIAGLRIAVPTHSLYTDAEPEILDKLENALAIFRNLGATVQRIAIPEPTRLYALADVIGKVEAAALHAEWIRERPDDYQTAVRTRIESGLYIPAVRYLEAVRLRSLVLKEFAQQVFEKADVLYLPTLTTLTPTIAETAFTDTELAPKIISRMTQATRAINYLGLPAISIPCGFTATGLPTAFQIVGRPFDESTLLRAGHAYESATSWTQQAPPVCSSADDWRVARSGNVAQV